MHTIWTYFDFTVNKRCRLNSSVSSLLPHTWESTEAYIAEAGVRNMFVT